MKIDVAAYISQLLFEHDCVIIPGFGGFITNYQPATIDYAQGFLHPPTKSITFNQNLTLNDGLLINYIARKEFVGYDEARMVVEDYAKDCKKKLGRKEILPIPNVGKLYKDIELKLQFLPDATNFRTESFGLPKLQYYPILRTKPAAASAAKVAPKTKVATKTTPTVKKVPASVEKKGVKRFLPATAAAIIFGLVALFLFNLSNIDLAGGALALDEDSLLSSPPNLDKSVTASMVPRETLSFNRIAPFSKPENNNDDGDDMEEDSSVSNLTEDELKELTEDLVKDDDDLGSDEFKEMTAEEYKAKLAHVDKTLSNKNHRKYVIIVGAFKSKDLATNLMTRINADGNESEMNKRGSLYRVGLKISCEPKDLQSKLKMAKKVYSERAWVL